MSDQKKPLKFTIEKKLDGTLARAGVLETPHGTIETPAFVTVGTKATVKALSPEQVRDAGAQVVLANTYHLYLEPGHEKVAHMGGLGKMMNWHGPTMTDSGGFQVFSLGAAFGEKVSKLASIKQTHSHAKSKDKPDDGYAGESLGQHTKLAKIDEDGVTFKSYRDGSEHRFTPERSIEIQHAIGADMIFVFDECTSPGADYEYQKSAGQNAVSTITSQNQMLRNRDFSASCRAAAMKTSVSFPPRKSARWISTASASAALLIKKT